MLITFSIYNQFYSPGYLSFKRFQNVFCKSAKAKEMNFRKLAHDWFNKEAWQDSIQCISVTFREEYKGCIFSATEKCESNSFAIHFLKALCRILCKWGDKRSYRKIIPTYFLWELLHVHRKWFATFLLFPNSGKPCGSAALSVCGKRGCLCNKHNSCWSLAYSGWKSLAWAHGSWWCCPSGLLAASSSWSTCHGGQDGAPPVPRAWDWCEEIERGVGMTTMALLWPLGCRVFLGLL